VFWRDDQQVQQAPQQQAPQQQAPDKSKVEIPFDDDVPF
jgi:hypothetical protein